MTTAAVRYVPDAASALIAGIAIAKNAMTRVASVKNARNAVNAMSVEIADVTSAENVPASYATDVIIVFYARNACAVKVA